MIKLRTDTWKPKNIYLSSFKCINKKLIDHMLNIKDLTLI